MKRSTTLSLFILLFCTSLFAQTDTIPLSKKRKKAFPVYVDTEFGLMPISSGRNNFLGDISTGYRFSENIALGISTVLTKTVENGSASSVGVQCRWTPLRFLIVKGEYGYVYDYHIAGIGTYLPAQSNRSYTRASVAICFLRVFSVGGTLFSTGKKVIKYPPNYPVDYLIYGAITNTFWQLGLNIPLRKRTVFEQAYLF